MTGIKYLVRSGSFECSTKQRCSSDGAGLLKIVVHVVRADIDEEWKKICER